LKKIFYLLIILSLITSCKSKKPVIITSKKVAIKKKKYDDDLNIRILVSNKKSTPEKSKKSVDLNVKDDEDISYQPKEIILTNTDDVVITSDDSNYLIEQLIYYASENLGIHYRSGGTTKAGFDCSGLMYSTFKIYNIILPRSSSDMAKIGLVKEKKEARKGDLIFFKTRGKSQISHVGMITEVGSDGEIKFIHSSTQNGVIISSTKESYYQRTFAQINRIIE
jgi:lipoprotein Spr